MTFIKLTNILLIGLCIFTMLLVWSRNWKRRQAYLEKIKADPESLQWLGRHLSGRAHRDLKAVSDRFGLPLLQALQLIDFYRKTNRKA